MPNISSHVLDTSTGQPAGGIRVRLEQVTEAGFIPLAAATTDRGGRIRDWLPGGVPGGRYRLVFEVGDWLTAAGRPAFYPEIVILVDLREAEPHYHIPLLLAPFGYTTYRGS